MLGMTVPQTHKTHRDKYHFAVLLPCHLQFRDLTDLGRISQRVSR
jgi:hypothetical protein